MKGETLYLMKLFLTRLNDDVSIFCIIDALVKGMGVL